MNKELKEWLGIRPADFAVYGGIGAVVWMYYSMNVTIDVILSVVAAVLCSLACYLGMRSDAQLSATTNLAKRVSYPLCLVAILVCIYLNFAKWNAAGAG